MSWLSKLLGGGSKSPTTTGEAGSDDNEDSYTVGWRNKYMAARIINLDKRIAKKNIGGVIGFDLPEDVQSGNLEDLQALNQKLTKRVEYLEGLLNGR